MNKKKRIIKRLKHRLEYVSIKLLSAVFTIMPLRLVYLISRMLCIFTYHVIRIRRDVTMENLRNSLGEEFSKKELEKIACKAYVNIGITFMEMLIVHRFKEHILEMVDMSDSYILKHNMDRGHGVIVVSCHFGSWELIGAAISASGIPMTVVVKKLSNPYIDNIIYQLRTGFGNNIINYGASVKHIVRALRNNEVIGLISDQDAGREGIFIDFFGRKASTPRGAALLALKYKAPIVVAMTVRTGNGKYKSIFKELTVYENDTIETVTRRYTAVMEDIIRQYPEQYFWMHRRWKTKESNSIKQ